MNGHYEVGDTVFGNWTLTRLIGEGSYGRVFEARREDFGRIYESAVKIITVPQNQSEVQSVMADGMDEESVTVYFRGFVEEMVDEFALMARLKGHDNIVSYEDHTVVQHSEGIGWDLFIRMELLTPLLTYTQQHVLTKKDVMQLGIDMCRALELCQKYNIVHRDIKPENIFVSDVGDFKLGDFGIAKTIEKTTGALSKKGTYSYMAPEVYRGEPYSSNVDIYSLGIVLYRLLNDNRTPFLPAYPAPITHTDRENALDSRISGAPLPAPKNADGRLAEIVLKACSAQPNERYSSPLQMRQELEAILYSREEAPLIYPNGDETPVKSVEYISTDLAAQPVPQAHPAAPDTAAVCAVGVPNESEKTTSLFGTTSAEYSRTDQAAYAQQQPVPAVPSVNTAPGMSPNQRPGSNAKALKRNAGREKSAVVTKWVLCIFGLLLVALTVFLFVFRWPETIETSSGQVICITKYNAFGKLVEQTVYDKNGDVVTDRTFNRNYYAENELMFDENNNFDGWNLYVYPSGSSKKITYKYAADGTPIYSYG